MICDFCNLDQTQVKYLIAGIRSNICNECVDVCNEILVQSKMTKVKFNVIATVEAENPLKKVE